MATDPSRPSGYGPPPGYGPHSGYGPRWHALLAETGWGHSFELPDGSLVRGVCEIQGLKDRLAQFPIPPDLRGKRVLDVGAWDGWFSFELERRGAEVLAIDCWDNPRFHQMRSMLHSKVEYRVLDVYDVSPETVGRFDIVLFMGVLYHMKHPLLALERVCSVTREMAVVDSYVLADGLDPNAKPVLEFYESDEFEGNVDNWVAPNLACLMAMCRTAGFARVELAQILPYGAGLTCFRQWTPEIRPESPVPELLGAIHNRNGGINFTAKGDQYLTCYIKLSAEVTDLATSNVQPQVGPYGVYPVCVKRLNGETWMVNFRLPPGLPAGWHDVSIRLENGAPSVASSQPAFKIAVDVPLPEAIPTIKDIRDASTWTLGEIDLSKGDALAIWACGLPENADMANVRVFLNGEACTVLFVAAGDAHAARQLNARVPENLRPGTANVSLQAGNAPRGPAARLRVIVASE